jgi:hypothetical protein
VHLFIPNTKFATTHRKKYPMQACVLINCRILTGRASPLTRSSAPLAGIFRMQVLTLVLLLVRLGSAVAQSVSSLAEVETQISSYVQQTQNGTLSSRTSDLSGCAIAVGAPWPN